MDDELPAEFDLVVIGTGFPESVVAAAASRIGKTVLHLDPNEFYGGQWSSFNLEAFQNFIENSSKEATNNDELNGKSLKITENFCGISNAKQEWHVTDEVKSTEEDSANAEVPVETSSSEATETTDSTNTDPALSIPDNKQISTKDDVLKNFRKFNIDLIPKILYGGGKLVELLISSNICRYAEFRAIDKIITLFENEIKNVPCSRSDVFNSKDLKIIEKRLLMKLLTSCMNYGTTKKLTEYEGEGESSGGNLLSVESFKEYENKTFLEYLRSQNLTDKIIHCVLYAISMSNEKTSFKNGVENIKKFLNSLGRYGNTPFLFPMYGCGELPQDFCRLCAVFGGIYCLKRSIENLTIENEQITTIRFNNQDIKIKNLVIGSNNIPNGLTSFFIKDDEKNEETKCGGLSRGILITSTPIGNDELNSGGGGVNIMRLPGEEEGHDGAFIIQLSHFSGTCPKGLYLIHITIKSKSESAENDIKPYIQKLFNENNENLSKILYSSYYQIPSCKKCLKQSKLLLKNTYLTCGPYYEIDYDKSIENAYEIFKKLYPNDEFLPRAPDPEEIIIGNEDPTCVEGEQVEEGEKNEEGEEVKEDDNIKEIENGIKNQVKLDEENAKSDEKAEAGDN